MNRKFNQNGEKVMTLGEFRETEEYKEIENHIKSYPKGGEFSVRYFEHRRENSEHLKKIAWFCVSNGILRSVNRTYDLTNRLICERFVKL